MEVVWFSLGFFLATLLWYWVWRGSREGMRRSLKGKISEQMFPLFSDYRASDMRFLGSPVDYIVFRGYSEGKIDEVVFLEVKSGGTLSTVERSLRDAVERGKVRFEVVEFDMRGKGV